MMCYFPLVSKIKQNVLKFLFVLARVLANKSFAVFYHLCFTKTKIHAENYISFYFAAVILLY